MILAGKKQLWEIPIEMAGSPLFNTFVNYHLSFFDKHEAEELIRQPTYGLIAYSDEAVDRLYALTGGHPYLIQVFCSLIITYCRENKVMEITPKIIIDLIPQFLERSDYFWADLWRNFSPDQKDFLAMICELLNKQESFTVDNLDKSNKLSSKKVKSSHSHVMLDHLSDVIKNENGNFTFAMELLPIWLKNNQAE